MITAGCSDAASEPYCERLDLDAYAPESWPHVAQKWLDEHVQYESQTLSLFLSAEHEPAREWLTAMLGEHYRHCRINQTTVLANAENQGRNFIHGLTELASGRGVSATHALPSMRGHTCFVVGAGPSLDENIDELKLHRGPILAVNTSIGALALHGIRPTAVVVLESRDIREGLRLNTTGAPLAVTMTTHPNNWTEGGSGPALAYCDTEPCTLAYAKALRMTPIASGPSCTTVAVGLALAMGARVALIGQDCGFAADGRMYAAGTPYQDVRATFHDAAGVVTYHKLGQDRAEQMAVVPGVGGNPVHTTYGMQSFAMWFAQLPADVKARAVNCTASGAKLHGIAEASAHDIAQAEQYDPRPQPLGQRHIEAKAIVDRLRAACENPPDDRHAEAFAREHRVINMWVSAERLRMRDGKWMSPVQQRARIGDTVRRACSEALEVMNGPR